MTDQQLVAVNADDLDLVLAMLAIQMAQFEPNNITHALHRCRQALANPGVTVEGDAVGGGFVPDEGVTLHIEGNNDSLRSAFEQIIPGPCLVTVTSIKGVSDE